MRAISGVCPVLETPFHEDGSVDDEGFVRIVDHMVAAGVRNVMFPGFASEFHKLSDSERSRLTTILLKRTADVKGFVAVISIPDHATTLAVARAKEAVASGARALNVLPPHFLGPSRGAVREHLLAVLRAVAPTPVVLQYAPSQTGTALDADTIAEIARLAPNLVQVKVESTPPGALITALSATVPPLESLVGSAGVQLPDALRRGAVGVEPGCSFVELYLEVWRLWQDGQQDDATCLHQRMLPYLSYWMQSSELIIAAEKEISRKRGIIDSSHCRAPAHELDPEERAMIDRFLSEFAEFLSIPAPVRSPRRHE
ncbi:dihydrodipicolinate synthase family protein [Leifsonia bigeumensis]|uniref:Dihydrodipicolinate synthase family protein n=1 Tax=Leifsonella bigeumensis TaxID=433643 RepID=A0ABP7FDB4_9MICO